MYIKRQERYYTDEEIQEITEKHKLAISKNPHCFGDLSKIPNIIMLSRNLITNNAKCLYNTLFILAGQDYSCFPTQTTLTDILGVGTRQTVRRYIDELVDLGLIEVILTKDDNQRYPNNVYKILPITDSIIWDDLLNQVEDVNKSISKNRIEGNDTMYGESYIPDNTMYDRQYLVDIYTDSTDSSNKREKRLREREREKQHKVKRIIHGKKEGDNKGSLFRKEIKNDLKLPQLEERLNALDKNKNRLDCAVLKFTIAEIKEDWDDIKPRDFAYYFKDIKYEEYYKDVEKKPMRVNKYLAADIKKFTERYDLKPQEYLDVMDYLLEEYEKHKDENFPRVTQSLFRQDWKMDIVMARYIRERDKKEEELKLERKLQEVREQMIAEGLDPDMREVF